MSFNTMHYKDDESTVDDAVKKAHKNHGKEMNKFDRRDLRNKFAGMAMQSLLSHDGGMSSRIVKEAFDAAEMMMKMAEEWSK